MRRPMWKKVVIVGTHFPRDISGLICEYSYLDESKLIPEKYKNWYTSFEKYKKHFVVNILKEIEETFFSFKISEYNTMKTMDISIKIGRQKKNIINTVGYHNEYFTRGKLLEYFVKKYMRENSICAGHVTVIWMYYDCCAYISRSIVNPQKRQIFQRCSERDVDVSVYPFLFPTAEGIERFLKGHDLLWFWSRSPVPLRIVSSRSNSELSF